MRQITIDIKKAYVLDEVAKLSSYAGAKLIEADPGALDRIMATDADLETMDRFWDETISALEERLKDHLVKSEFVYVGDGTTDTADGTTDAAADGTTHEADTQQLTLSVGSRMSEAIEDSLRKSMQGYCIGSMAAMWYALANKDGVEEQLQKLNEKLMSSLYVIYSRKRPTKPTSTDTKTDTNNETTEG
jgi:hypothetical protein